ncbi:MAG: hypothetical protein LBU94_03850, partial [Clostridiales bacterium]|nr:hypothetical protein [Clostridiales bacterium]
MKTRNTEDLLLFIGCFLFAFGAVSGLMSITVLSAGNVYIMLRVLIFTGLFFLVFKSKRTMLISLGILAAAALYIGTRYLKEEVPVFYEDLALYTAQTIRFINGYTDYEKVYNLITINLLCIFMSFVTVGLIKARLRIILLFLIGAGIFVFANTFSPTGMHITFLPMLAGLFIFVAIKMREGRRGRFKMTAIAVSVGLIAVIISYIMPVPERVRDYYIAYTDTYDFLYKTFRQPFMPKYYTSRTMGFTDTQGELGGWLRADNEFIMFVYADEPVYLRGVSKNIYTGRGWTGENEETFSQNLLFYDDAPDSFVDFTTLISVGYTSE